MSYFIWVTSSISRKRLWMNISMFEMPNSYSSFLMSSISSVRRMMYLIFSSVQRRQRTPSGISFFSLSRTVQQIFMILARGIGSTSRKAYPVVILCLVGGTSYFFASYGLRCTGILFSGVVRKITSWAGLPLLLCLYGAEEPSGLLGQSSE